MKTIHKNIGETPLECINRNNKDNKTVSYAGRLDPMAEGDILMLEDDECKEREKYLGLDKIYRYKAVLGIETDSLDFLGLITNVKSFIPTNIKEIVEGYIGDVEMEAPIYSSQVVEGKKLFWYARNNTPVKLPLIKSKIYGHKYFGDNMRSGGDIAREAIENVSLVNGDFRQKEIIENWMGFNKEYGSISFFEYEAEVEVSSGTYIRSILKEIANIQGSFAFSTNINRTKIIL